jgi:hypothetical protein
MGTQSTTPSVSEADFEGAKATLPKCPTCGGEIWLVQFIAHQTHRFHVEFNEDGKGGIDLDAYSGYSDTLDVEPVMQDLRGPVERPAVVVECKNKHSWVEPRLKIRRQHSGDETEWTILPPGPQAQPQLVWENLPSGEPVLLKAQR